jgi:hypothetical protein
VDFSKQASSLLGVGWRHGTKASYKSAWNQWSSWCVEWSIDPLQASVVDIDNFLTTMFDAGKEYNNIHGYRSTIISLSS